MDTMMEKMMAFMMGRMTDEEKHAMMESMMEKFFSGMTIGDREKLMTEMMPHMMEGVDMSKMMPKMMMGMMGSGSQSEGGHEGMMPKMMAESQSRKMEMMPHMMMEMMPHCLSVMLPRAPKKKRAEFVHKMIAILVEKGCAGMSDQQKKEFVAQVAEQVKASAKDNSSRASSSAPA